LIDELSETILVTNLYGVTVKTLEIRQVSEQVGLVYDDFDNLLNQIQVRIW
jgi:hypothetical protein